MICGSLQRFDKLLDRWNERVGVGEGRHSEAVMSALVAYRDIIEYLTPSFSRR